MDLGAADRPALVRLEIGRQLARAAAEAGGEREVAARRVEAVDAAAPGRQQAGAHPADDLASLLEGGAGLEQLRDLAPQIALLVAARHAVGHAVERAGQVGDLVVAVNPGALREVAVGQGFGPLGEAGQRARGAPGDQPRGPQGERQGERQPEPRDRQGHEASIAAAGEQRGAGGMLLILVLGGDETDLVGEQAPLAERDTPGDRRHELAPLRVGRQGPRDQPAGFQDRSGHGRVPSVEELADAARTAGLVGLEARQLAQLRDPGGNRGHRVPVQLEEAVVAGDHEAALAVLGIDDQADQGLLDLELTVHLDDVALGVGEPDHDPQTQGAARQQWQERADRRDDQLVAESEAG